MNRQRFFNLVRHQPFPGKLTAEQVQGTEVILNEWERQKQSNLQSLAYVLATAKWETAHTMQPIREMGGQDYLRSKPYYPWYGRGFVQLTWETNYRKYQEPLKRMFGIDIIANPDGALNPKAAAFVLIHGILNGVFAPKYKGIADFMDAAGNVDFREARRLVNGVDRASEIAAIAKMFYADLVRSQT